MKKLIPKLIGLYLNVLAWLSPRTAGRKGFYLFCTPFGAPLQDHQRKFLDTAIQSKLTFEGDEIQVYRWGTGPKVILFLHGWQSHSFRWKNYIDALSKEDYTVYAFDATAHGNSGGKYLNLPVYSRAIEKFLSTVPPVHAAIGHSLGAFATLYTHFRLGSLPVEKFIFMAPPGEAHEFVTFYQRVLGLSKKTVSEIIKSFNEELGLLPEFFSAVKFAKDLSILGLIIHDRHDAEAPYEYAVAINRVWKNSKLITTTGLGHNLRSAQTVKQVIDFIATPAIIQKHETSLQSIPA